MGPCSEEVDEEMRNEEKRRGIKERELEEGDVHFDKEDSERRLE